MIINRQKRVAIPGASLERFLGRVRRELKLGGTEMAVCFVTDGEIKKLNTKYRGKAKPTDVLSFPAAEAGVAEWPKRNGKVHERAAARDRRRFLGDIAISPETARRNALHEGRSVDAELKILMLHGTLHLLGYDHETDDGQMDRAEAKLRRRLRLA